MKYQTYQIYVRSNENKRTINHYQNSRCYYTKLEVVGKDALIEKCKELIEKGERIDEIRRGIYEKIFLFELGL